MIDIKNTIQACTRHRKRSTGGQCLILLYHRVCTLDIDPLMLSVSHEHFADHLDILRSRYRPISLRQLVDALRDDAVPDDSVVVTLDDGYLDNLQHAKPLLEKFDIPATVFVASGYVGGEREFWWDELERLLLQGGDLPKSLRVRINGSVCEQFLGEDALDKAASFRKRSAWNIEQDDLSRREGLFRRLQAALRTLDDARRQRVLSELVTWAGIKPEPRASHRVMSPDDLIQLAAGGLVEIGGHTVSHPVLSTLRPSAQRDEIVPGKTRLESILGHLLESFSYPFGTRGDYGPATVKIVRKAGFRCACSNFPGLANRRTDVFQLPRSIVRDWDGDTFASRLNEWTRVQRSAGAQALGSTTWSSSRSSSS